MPEGFYKFDRRFSQNGQVFFHRRYNRRRQWDIPQNYMFFQSRAVKSYRSVIKEPRDYAFANKSGFHIANLPRIGFPKKNSGLMFYFIGQERVFFHYPPKQNI